MPEYSLETLLQLYFDDQLTKEQEQQLFELISQGTHDEEIKLFMDRSWPRLATHYTLPDSDKDVILRSIFSTPPRRVHVLTTAWFRYAAAVVLLLCVGAYLWNRNTHKEEVAQQAGPVSLQKDVPPGREGATLTLADGRQLVLDSLGNGIIATQNGSKVALNDGQLLYDPAEDDVAAPAYNTMTTARGRQFRLVLPDGSAVWLNAASSITYPTSFGGATREVAISGEAYFEVAKNPGHPFIVHAGKEKVTVLGTHFNVMAYDDEASINTTLLEGSVKVVAPGYEKILVPGQQARLAGGQLRVHSVDTADVVAWVRGQLSMENVDIAGLMRQVSRWYDVDVELRGTMPNKHFFGMIDRNASYLSGISQVLEANGLQVTMNGRKIIVTSK
jgi:transmembrane sensor